MENILSWKTFNTPNLRTFKLSLAYFKCTPNAHMSLHLGQIISTSPFYKVWLSCVICWHCTESEKWNGYVHTEWLSVFCLVFIMIAWLTDVTAVAAQHHETGSDHMLLARKSQNSKLSKLFPTECVLLLYHCKVKNSLSWTIVSQRPFWRVLGTKWPRGIILN